ncbi:MAG: AI-2E family transporter [Ramlibacter sp.]
MCRRTHPAAEEVLVKFDRLVEQSVGLVALAVLALVSLVVVAPFMTALLWGAILAYCSLQPYRRLARALGGRNGIAAVLLVLAILLVVIVPILYAGIAFSASVPDLVTQAQGRLEVGLPPLPHWLAQLPLVGERLADGWNALSSRNPETIARLRELARPVLLATLGAGLSVLQGLGLLVLSVLFAGFFYVSGGAAGKALEAGLHRIAGDRAPYLLGLVGGTVKGVVYGILGTALVQAIVCAVGYWVSGLPNAGVLGLLTFFLAILPGGPLLVIIPGAIWLYQQGALGWAIFLVVWSGVAGILIDNVLKPVIIGKSSHIPFILILIGVAGGAAAFGLLGVFVGPTVLAVADAVFREWTATPEVTRAAEQAVPDPAQARPRLRPGEHREQPT